MSSPMCLLDLKTVLYIIFMFLLLVDVMIMNDVCYSGKGIKSHDLGFLRPCIVFIFILLVDTGYRLY